MTKTAQITTEDKIIASATVTDTEGIISNELSKTCNVFELRNNTSKDAREILFDIEDLEEINLDIAESLHTDCCEFVFAGKINENITKVNADNITRVYKHFELLTQNDFSLPEAICGEWIKNKTKKQYLTYIKDAFKERANDLKINVEDLDKEFDKTLTNAFSVWKAKLFGKIKSSDAQNFDKIFNLYSQRILEKEVEIRTKLFNKPVKDEEIDKFLDAKSKNDYYGFELTMYDEAYEKVCAKDTTLSKGIDFTGKVEYPSIQIGGSCVIHASINALNQNKNGEHLVNRMFRIKSNDSEKALVVCLPEALKHNRKYADTHNSKSVKTLSAISSLGDSDMAALICSLDKYTRNYKRRFAQVHLGFEVLSGEKAQVFLPDEPIPKGVGLTDATIAENYDSRQWRRISYSNVLYDNLKDILDNGNGAIVCTVRDFLWDNPDWGKFIKDLDSEEQTDINAFFSASHAYSVIKLTDKYAYLQESNHPNLFIKIEKAEFIRRMNQIATWRYD